MNSVTKPQLYKNVKRETKCVTNLQSTALNCKDGSLNEGKLVV